MVVESKSFDCELKGEIIKKGDNEYICNGKGSYSHLVLKGVNESSKGLSGTIDLKLNEDGKSIRLGNSKICNEKGVYGEYLNNRLNGVLRKSG